MGVEATGDGADQEGLEGIPRAGDVIAGKFAVEAVLGVGGMGVVVAAKHVHLGQKVAIKFLRAGAASQSDAVNRFLREARAAVGLQSAHVVRVMDVGTLDSGLPYMVMEHLSGTDLQQVIAQRKSLPVEEAVDYVLQGMEAIAEAHAIGIVHRDLKPANLFVASSPDGSPLVKVLDFGISKALDASGAQQQSLTATATIMGSPLYMSPEQLRSSKNVDARTDVWALGVILYELVAGSPPFEADTMTGLTAKIVADPPVPLRLRRPDVSQAFEAAVMRCLDKDVQRRPQSVSDLAAGLRPFATAGGQMSVDRIARIGGPPRSAQNSAADASGPWTPGGASSSPHRRGAPDQDAVGGGEAHGQTGFAETVATWQTTGVRRRKRIVTFATAGGIGAVVLALGVVAALKGTSGSNDAKPAATAVAAPDTPSTLPIPAAVVTLAPPATSAAATPSASTTANGTAATAPLAATTKPAWTAARPAGPPPKQTGAAPPPPKADDLLLDRK